MAELEEKIKDLKEQRESLIAERSQLELEKKNCHDKVKEAENEMEAITVELEELKVIILYVSCRFVPHWPPYTMYHRAGEVCAVILFMCKTFVAVIPFWIINECSCIESMEVLSTAVIHLPYYIDSTLIAVPIPYYHSLYRHCYTHSLLPLTLPSFNPLLLSIFFLVEFLEYM